MNKSLLVESFRETLILLLEKTQANQSLDDGLECQCSKSNESEENHERI